MPTIANSNAATKAELLVAALGTNTIKVANATGVANTDTANIRAAFASAGVGGTVIFPPAQTYSCWGGVVVQGGQKVIGNGSTLQRPNQVQALYGGVDGDNFATIPVAVGTGSSFSVGQLVCITRNDGTGDGFTTGYYNNTVQYTNAVKILSIAGDVLTLELGSLATKKIIGGTAFDNVNTFVVTTGYMFYVGNFDVTTLNAGAWANMPVDIGIREIVVDGNRVNNTKGRWWNTTGGLFIGCSDSVFSVIKIRNGMGDGMIFSGERLKFLHCSNHTSDGNFMHPGSWSGLNQGVNDAVVSECISYLSCQDRTVGHSDGDYIFSNDVHRLAYSNCLSFNSGMRGLGSSFNASDSDVTFTGCIVKGSNGGFENNGGANFVVTGCIFIDTDNNNTEIPPGSKKASGINNITSGADQTLIANNIFVNSPTYISNESGGLVSNRITYANNISLLRGVRRVFQTQHLGIAAGGQGTIGKITVQDNYFETTDTITANSQDGILVSGSANNVKVTGNEVIGGRFGIFVSGEVTNVTLENNTVVDSFDRNIYFGPSTIMVGIRIIGNTIRQNDLAAQGSTWYGIFTTSINGQALLEVSRNFIYSAATTGTQVGVLLNNPANNPIDLIGNVVRVRSGQTTVDPDGACTANNRFLFNRISAAMTANANTATLIPGATNSNFVGT